MNKIDGQEGLQFSRFLSIAGETSGCGRESDHSEQEVILIACSGRHRSLSVSCCINPLEHDHKETLFYKSM